MSPNVVIFTSNCVLLIVGRAKGCCMKERVVKNLLQLVGW